MVAHIRLDRSICTPITFGFGAEPTMLRSWPRVMESSPRFADWPGAFSDCMWRGLICAVAIGRPRLREAGGHVAWRATPQGLFYTTHRLFALPQNVSWVRRRPPRRRRPTSLHFLRFSVCFRKGVDCVSLLPGIFLLPRTPCLWLPLCKSSQKIVKGARLRCASASRSQSILPLFHLFLRIFSRPSSALFSSLFSLVPVALLPSTPIDHCQSLAFLADQP